jgi:multiple sugar transport system ATP-binding protein
MSNPSSADDEPWSTTCKFAETAAVYEDLFVAGLMGSPPMNLLPGKLRSTGGLHVETGEGGDDTIHFPRPDAMARQMSDADGRELTLWLRPETIFAEGTELPGKDRFVFGRTIDVADPTGPDTMIVFSFGGSDYMARVRPEDARQTGATFDFEVMMGEAKLFDRITGLRL